MGCDNKTLRRLYARKNTLQRYRQYAEYYSEIFHPDIPLERLWRKWIYPKFFISKSTLYKAISISIPRELEEVEKAIEECLKHREAPNRK